MAYSKHNFKTGDTLYAAQLNEMDAQIAANEQTANAALPKVGGTMTGMITLPTDPIEPMQAATKQYVDAVAAQGGGGTQPSVAVVEPAEDDIPKVFIDGEIPTTKDDVLAELTYVSKTETFKAFIKIKCQGSSSMSYPKKNFTVKLYLDEERAVDMPKLFKDWGVESSKYVLKADYLDHSHIRNVLGAKLWGDVVAARHDYNTLPVEMRNSPNNGAIDGFPVKVYTNGVYYGVYMWNIGKDAWMWGMDENNANHVLLCGETNTNNVYAENACNFRALWSGASGTDWKVEIGANSDSVKNSLNALISCVMGTDDDTFKSTIGNYLDIQSAIDYYIHQYVICATDNLAKNMLLATYDGVIWRCGAYDMDRAFGIKWEGGWAETDYRCPEDYQEKYNLLWERIEKCFPTELFERYCELKESVYSFANIFKKAEAIRDCIGSELYKEEYTIWPEMYFQNQLTIQQLRSYVHDRIEYCDKMFAVFSGIPEWSDEAYELSHSTGEITAGYGFVTLDMIPAKYGSYRLYLKTEDNSKAGTLKAVIYKKDGSYSRGWQGAPITHVNADIAEHLDEAYTRWMYYKPNGDPSDFVFERSGLWSNYGMYNIDVNTGEVISGSETITLAKIPVIGGTTYTIKNTLPDGAGIEASFPAFFEYDAEGNFLGRTEQQKFPFTKTLNANTAFVRLKTYIHPSDSVAAIDNGHLVNKYITFERQ